MASILLAEDDDSVRQFLAGTLEQAGHAVTSCPDGLAALAALEGDPFDLLLTDIVMPGLDGIELAAKARLLRPALKIVYITGFAAMAQQPAGAAGDKIQVISKPFHLNSIAQRVEEILRN
jgi:two-component system cell cycle response regulator CpdR